MSTAFWNAVTHLGNSMLLLPAAAVLALWLCAAGQVRLAGAWMLSLGGAALLVLASKLAFLGWGIGIAAIDFTGISGHAMVATAVFTMAAWTLVMHKGLPARAAGLAAGLGVGVLVGVSRLVLQVHSVSEVVSGCALGLLAALLPVLPAPAAAARVRHRWVPALLGAALLAVPQAGRPLESHGLVVQMALLASGRAEVFSRDVLHR